MPKPLSTSVKGNSISSLYSMIFCERSSLSKKAKVLSFEQENLSLIELWNSPSILGNRFSERTNNFDNDLNLLIYLSCRIHKYNG